MLSSTPGLPRRQSSRRRGGAARVYRMFGRSRAAAAEGGDGEEESPGGRDEATVTSESGPPRNEPGGGELQPLFSGRRPRESYGAGGDGGSTVDEEEGRGYVGNSTPLPRTLTPGPLAAFGGSDVIDEDEIDFGGRGEERSDPEGNIEGWRVRSNREEIGGPEEIPPDGDGGDVDGDADAEADVETGERQPSERRSPADIAASDRAAIASLTSQLRCLFTILTLPIIPLGTALSLLLLFVLYAALVTDLTNECSKPLKAYALTSLAVFVYTPQHRRLKRYIFRYNRERDGPVRPRGVRLFDQLYHTLCVMYVYAGMSLIRGCADDAVGADGLPDGVASAAAATAAEADPSAAGGTVADDLLTALEAADSSASHGTGAESAASQAAAAAVAAATFDPSMSTCDATCPALYRSTQTFMFTLELFAVVLVLPLVCLPCVYLWVVRRAGATAALARLREMEEDEDGAILRGEYGDGVGDGEYFTAEEILDTMETVTLSRLPAAAGGAASRGNAEAGKSDSTNASGAGREWDPGQSDGKGTAALGECCICMSEFRVAEVFQAGDAEGEDGSAEDAHEVDALLSVSHLVDNEVKDAAHNANDHHKSDNGVIVRTKCGHLFHRECLGGWIGGRWMDEAGGEGDENRRRRRRRKARRRCCPLCREDMAPVGSVNVNEDGD